MSIRNYKIYQFARQAVQLKLNKLCIVNNVGHQSVVIIHNVSYSHFMSSCFTAIMYPSKLSWKGSLPAEYIYTIHTLCHSATSFVHGQKALTHYVEFNVTRLHSIAEPSSMCTVYVCIVSFMRKTCMIMYRM